SALFIHATPTYRFRQGGLNEEKAWALIACCLGNLKPAIGPDCWVIAPARTEAANASIGCSTERAPRGDADDRECEHAQLGHTSPHWSGPLV
ncbi:MAG: hypothetical protein DMG98_27380, partial [Acidobacteria bacterium]